MEFWLANLEILWNFDYVTLYTSPIFTQILWTGYRHTGWDYWSAIPLSLPLSPQSGTHRGKGDSSSRHCQRFFAFGLRLCLSQLRNMARISIYIDCSTYCKNYNITCGFVVTGVFKRFTCAKYWSTEALNIFPCKQTEGLPGCHPFQPAQGFAWSDGLYRCPTLSLGTIWAEPRVTLEWSRTWIIIHSIPWHGSFTGNSRLWPVSPLWTGGQIRPVSNYLGYKAGIIGRWTLLTNIACDSHRIIEVQVYNRKVYLVHPPANQVFKAARR